MKKLFLLTAAACLLLASLAGCTAETPLPPTEAEGDDDLCTFTLSAGSRVSVETRVDSETAINDVWVVQLNKAGTSALTAPQYLTADPTTGKIRAKLEKEESKVYFFANTNSANLFNPAAALNTFTTASVEAVEITHTGDWATRTHIPMYGTWEGTPKTPVIADSPNDKVEMTPVLAMVYYFINGTAALTNFYLKSVQIKNVPGSTRMAPHPATETVYPATSTSFSHYPLISENYQLGTWGRNFYMPENCRGIGSERYETEKNGTLLSGGEQYATYLEIVCTIGTNNAVKLKYRFFLGENNINNYNIKRGYGYVVKITISGTNQSDTRVTVEGISNINGGGPTIDKDWGTTNDAGSVDLGINS